MHSDGAWPEPPDKPLKESLGHSRLEVLVGSLIGPAVALPGLVFVGSPIHLAAMVGLALGDALLGAHRRPGRCL